MSEKNRRRARLFLVQVFFVSIFLMIFEVYRSGREGAANRRLARQVEQIQESEESTREETSDTEVESEAEEGEEQKEQKEPEASGKEEEETGIREVKREEILPQYRELWDENHDMAGWLSIEDTRINYPVMYTPGNSEYYLHRSFDGSESVSGSLFIGAGWSQSTNHVIIYGHHMRNKTMFGDLDKYASESYAEEHPLICFDTLTQEGEYQVITAFYSQIYDLEETDVFRYYRHIDLSSREAFDKYIRQVREAALYDTGVKPEYGDSILTLSTCSYHTEDGRFVVVARKVTDENSLNENSVESVADDP